jgi:hypothetical protein
VHTESGTEPIESLKVGNAVLAESGELASCVLTYVSKTLKRTASEVVVIRIPDEEIMVTSEHPFWVVGMGWMRASDISAGDSLRTASGTHLVVKHIEVRQLDHPVTVYNLSVEAPNTFYIGNSAVLVHNKPL